MKKNIISFALIMCLSLLYIFNMNFFMASAKTQEENFTAKSLYLIDYNSNQVLFEKDAEKKLPVASIVKLMTIDLVCEEIQNGNLNIEDKVIVSDNAQNMGGSQVFIEANAEYSVGDLLKSTIISSANDASVALAEKIAGSEDEFVKLMNKKAKELGLNNTNYVNCTGLPASNQFSCAKDTATLLRDVTKYEIYHKYSTIWMDKLEHPKGRESELVNTNKLIKYYEGCDGGKTGSTSEAGYCLASTAKRGDLRLISVVLGAKSGKDRFSESSKLLNYGFGNFENKKVVDSSSVLEKTIRVKQGQCDYVNVKPLEDIYVLNKKHNKDSEIIVEYKLYDYISAPVKMGDKVGELFVIKDGEVVSKTNLISVQDVNSASLYDIVNRVVKNWKVR